MAKVTSSVEQRDRTDRHQPVSNSTTEKKQIAQAALLTALDQERRRPVRQSSNMR